MQELNNFVMAVLNTNNGSVESHTFEDGNKVTRVNAAYNSRQVNPETGEIFRYTDWFEVQERDGNQIQRFFGGKNPAKSIIVFGKLAVRGYTATSGDYRVDMRIHADNIRASAKSMLPYFHLMIEGNLGADPVERELEDGTQYMTGTVYLNRGYYDEGELVNVADRISVSGFGNERMAELRKYHSGDSLKLVGRPMARSYADAEGINHPALNVRMGRVADYESNEVFAVLTAAADPTLREFENGGRVATVRALHNRNYKDSEGKDQQDTRTFHVQGWNKNADLIMAHVKQGESVFVEGAITAEVFPETENRKQRGAMVLTGRIFRFAHGYVRPMVKTMLTGHLGKDVIVRETKAGQPVANLEVGINSWFMARGERVSTTEWVDGTFWSKTAQNAGKYLVSGSRVRLSGLPTLKTFINDDGVMTARVVLDMASVQYLSKRAAVEMEEDTADADYVGELD